MFRLAIRVRNAVIPVLFTVSIVICDQLIKHFVSKTETGKIIMPLPPILDIVRMENSGAAFSLLSGKTVLLLSATSAMLLALLWAILFYRKLSQLSRFACAGLLGGGLGNWIDRLATGTVCDYIRLRFIEFPVFNLADIFITLSVAGLILLLLTERFESIPSGEIHGAGY